MILRSCARVAARSRDALLAVLARLGSSIYKCWADRPLHGTRVRCQSKARRSAESLPRWWLRVKSRPRPSMVPRPLLCRRVAAFEFIPRLGRGARTGSHGLAVSSALSSIRYRVSIGARRQALGPWRARVRRPMACEWLWAWNCEGSAEPTRAWLPDGHSTSPARAAGWRRRASRVGNGPSTLSLDSTCVTGAARQAHDMTKRGPLLGGPARMEPRR